MMRKVVTVVGPTASGKSSLAILLARKFGGQIVSADSRQVYKGMDLGTGKVTMAERRIVPHHLLDVASPGRRFTVDHFVRLSTKAIEEIARSGDLPFIVGGSAFYVYSLIDGLRLPKVKPDARLRRRLERLDTDQLYRELKRKDPRRAAGIDRQNRRRLIRALEIIDATGKPIPLPSNTPRYETLILGVRKSREELKKLIEKRLDSRLHQGMIAEVKRLITAGVSYKRLDEFGLEYRHVARYLTGKATKEEMRRELLGDIIKFAKRQMTWFKKDNRIIWVENPKEAERAVRNFIKR